MSEKWGDRHSLPAVSSSNNSCVQVVDGWLDNAREQRALSLLSKKPYAGWEGGWAMEMEIAERRRSVREESRVKMEMGNERDEAVVIATSDRWDRWRRTELERERDGKPASMIWQAATGERRPSSTQTQTSTTCSQWDIMAEYKVRIGVKSLFHQVVPEAAIERLQSSRGWRSAAAVGASRRLKIYHQHIQKDKYRLR